jgi:nucleotide-binding universal stress UspA family protein
MYKKIMVPTDGSGFDRDAIRVALRLADRCQAEVRLVRVVTSAAVLGLGEPFERTDVSPHANTTEVGEAYAELNALAAECRAIGDAPVSTELLDGPTAEMLEGCARRNDVDLIVMSSHARGGLSRLTLGSVTDSLIRHTHVPVLVVKPAAGYMNLRPPTAMKRIIVPIDGSSLAERILPRVAALARLEGSGITLLHVIVSAPRRAGMNDEATQSDRDAELARVYLNRIAHRLPVGQLRVDTHVVIAADVSAAIREYAAVQEADLIAIATHGRGGLARMIRGSVADAVTRSSPTSMLVFRPEQRVERQSTVRSEPALTEIPVS